MAFAKPRGVSKTLYGQRRLHIGETMGGGGGGGGGTLGTGASSKAQTRFDIRVRINKLFGTKGHQTKADNQTKGQQSIANKVYDPYNYPASGGKFPAKMNPKRMSFKEEMFKIHMKPRKPWF